MCTRYLHGGAQAPRARSLMLWWDTGMNDSGRDRSEPVATAAAEEQIVCDGSGSQYGAEPCGVRGHKVDNFNPFRSGRTMQCPRPHTVRPHRTTDRRLGGRVPPGAPMEVEGLVKFRGLRTVRKRPAGLHSAVDGPAPKA
jgi:hypothetical protein